MGGTLPGGTGNFQLGRQNNPGLVFVKIGNRCENPEAYPSGHCRCFGFVRNCVDDCEGGAHCPHNPFAARSAQLIWRSASYNLHRADGKTRLPKTKLRQ